MTGRTSCDPVLLCPPWSLDDGAPRRVLDMATAMFVWNLAQSLPRIVGDGIVAVKQVVANRREKHRAFSCSTEVTVDLESFPEVLDVQRLIDYLYTSPAWQEDDLDELTSLTDDVLQYQRSRLVADIVSRRLSAIGLEARARGANNAANLAGEDMGNSPRWYVGPRGHGWSAYEAIEEVRQAISSGVSPDSFYLSGYRKVADGAQRA